MAEAQCVPAQSRATGWHRALAVVACGWAGVAAAGTAVIEIDPASIVSTTPGAPGVVVEVSDLRESGARRRPSIGHVSLEDIEFSPPLTELLAVIIAARADGIAAEQPGAGDDAPPPVVACELRSFSIETPATLLYWDIASHIAIVLRVGERDREVEASAGARTWVYPSRGLLEQVTHDTLVDLAAGIEAPLRELLAAPEQVEAEPSLAGAPAPPR